MQKTFHLRDDVDRLYVPRKRGRRLASVDDSVDVLIQRLGDYIEKRGERLITAIRNNTDSTRTTAVSHTRTHGCGKKRENFT